MKKEGRSVLFCSKEMSNGKLDTFHVNVVTSEKDAYKKKYEDMGYTVRFK